MAEVEEKQTEATGTDQEPEETSAKEKKPKKSRKTKEKGEESADKEDKPKKIYPRYADTPKIHDMIIEALDVLDERKGVTFPAIKRYLEDNYHVDTAKLASHVRKIMTKCVEDGDIVRTRGVGCSGRFKVKHSKPTMIKKRCAPEDYQELPNPPRAKPRPPKPAAKKETAAATPKKGATAAAKKVAAASAKSKKGRPGRRK